MLHTHRQRGEVHDPQLLFDRFAEFELLVPLSAGVLHGVSGVDAINLRSLEQDVGIEFGSAQGRTGVGRKEGITGAGNEDQ